MDPNPYDPPREPQPLSAGKIAKRGLGVGAIILLMPLAVAIAIGGSCAATYALLSIPVIRESRLIVTVMLAIFVVPPGMVLAAMIRWAIRTHRKDRLPGSTSTATTEPSQPQPPLSLWERLVAFPSPGSLALWVLTTVVLSILFFLWLLYALTSHNPPP